MSITINGNGDINGIAGLAFNNAGNDANFRIESDTKENAFWVDGGTGNVGIGTNDPTNSLYIKNTTANDGVRIHSSTTGEGYVVFRDDDQTSPGAVVYDHSVDMLSFKVANVTDRVVITSQGNFGINTTSPAEKLEVVGNVNIKGTDSNARFHSLKFERYNSDTDFVRIGFASESADNSEFIIDTSGNGNPLGFVTIGDAFNWYNDGGTSAAMTLTSDTELGIGTNNPQSRLHISGASGSTSAMVRIAENTTGNNNSIAIGHWDNTYNRIEGAGGRSLFITNYSDRIYMGLNGGIEWAIGANPNYINGTAQLYSGTFNLTTTATDVYQNATGTIGSGTYLLSVNLSGSSWYSETWTGIMRWYSGTTNNNNATTIHMTGFGHAIAANQVLYARVKRYGGNTNLHSLQLWSNTSTSPNITIQVRRIG
jgi:hypothetical protein